MVVIILRNLDLLIKYNRTRAQIMHIGQYTIEVEVIGKSRVDT